MLVYYLPLDAAEWDGRDEALMKHISEQRREQVMRFRFDSDRRLCLYAGLVARMGISLMTGIPTGELVFCAQKNQKPYLVSAFEIDFSFSHTKGGVLCCISDKGDVGADIEGIAEAPLKVMRRVFHPAEKDYVFAAPEGEQRNERFFRVWTAKEAYTKKLGTGLACDLSSCNTLEMSDTIHTWREGACCCAVSGNTDEIDHFDLKRLTLAGITGFFL